MVAWCMLSERVLQPKGKHARRLKVKLGEGGKGAVRREKVQLSEESERGCKRENGQRYWIEVNSLGGMDEALEIDVEGKWKQMRSLRRVDHWLQEII